jgi:hypothetical protein
MSNPFKEIVERIWHGGNPKARYGGVYIEWLEDGTVNTKVMRYSSQIVEALVITLNKQLKGSRFPLESLEAELINLRSKSKEEK